MASQVSRPDTWLDAASLIGVPYLKNGRDPKTGLDCFGTLVECYRRMGVELPPAETGRTLSENAVLIEAHKGDWVEVSKQPHVAVLFRVKFQVCHVGFTLPHGKFIHTLEGTNGVAIERLANWEKRVAGYYDYRPAQ